MGTRRVADASKAVERLYAYGRTDGRHPPKLAGKPAPDISPPYERPDPRQQAIQDPEAKHAPGYSNDVAMDWHRGKGLPPHFDHSAPSGQRYKR